MLNFHCIVHRAPIEGPEFASAIIGETKVSTIRVRAPFEPLPVTFDEAAATLQAIEGVHFEMDGWFIWGQGADAARWQVDGQLSDGGTHLEFVEMRGNCSADTMDTLLAAFGSTREELCIQLLKEGVFVDLPTFKKIASQTSS